MIDSLEDRLTDSFEDHCWKDIVPPEILDVYSHYKRNITIAAPAALVAIDLYELAYQGGAKPVPEVAKTYQSSCGEYAWAAIEPTRELFAAARAAKLPIFYSTAETRPDSKPRVIQATARVGAATEPAAYEIRGDFAPQPGDTIIRKQRASAFYGTSLSAHLTQLGIRTIVMCGESTSGCVRASAVDAYSLGFNVVLVEECCFDRFVLSHKINLFDLHHKYAGVMHLDVALQQLRALGT
jgi:nicotinamidase-related amidase